MKVNGIDLVTLPKEAITPLQLKILIAQAKVKARDFARKTISYGQKTLS